MRNLTMMTDFYQLTMMYGYQKEHIDDRRAVFDVFYRRVLMGEAFNCPSESYGNGLFKYGVKAVKKVKNENGKKEQVTVAALASDKENFISKGLVGNFMTIFQQWSFSAGK